MVKKAGQRRFLLKCGYTNEQLDRMTPGTAHNIISEIEKANCARRDAEQRAKQEAAEKAEVEILREALEYFVGMHGFTLERYKDEDDGTVEYSCNGYVVNEETMKVLVKAKKLIGWWE